MKKKKINPIIFGIVFLLALGLGLFLIWQKKANFGAKSGSEQIITASLKDIFEKSPISGVSCENANRRPIAVMLSGDSVTRPLSAISQADLVFEMSVVEGGITRLMAVFVCSNPTQIGSVRSARHDFIPLALGLDAIYAHWGGSHFALEKIKLIAIDNLDALPNPYSTFYRQSGVEAPHNGFTSMTRLVNGSKKLDYRLVSKFAGYPHLSESEIVAKSKEKKVLTIEYAGPFKVSYQYDPEANSYWRYRDNIKEIDKNTKQQVEAKNVVIMRALSEPLEDQYNDVQVEGQGQAEYYLNGEAKKGIWKKDRKDPSSKLFFYDNKGQEIKFVPGSIWIEIADPGMTATWK